MIRARAAAVTLVLALSTFARDAYAQSSANTADCASPRRAVDTFLRHQQADDTRLDLASACFDDIAGEPASPARAKVASRLKDVLDLRALFVDLEKIPDVADFVEPGTNEARWVLFPRSLPQVYLVKQGAEWRFSAETVRGIDALHSATHGAWVAQAGSSLPAPLRQRVLGVAVWQMVALLLLLLAAFATQKIVAYAALRWSGRALSRARNVPQWGEGAAISLDRPLGLLAFTAVMAAGFPALRFYVMVNVVAFVAFKVLAVLSVVWGLYRLVDVLSQHLISKAEKTATKLDDQLIPLLRKTLKAFVLMVGTLFVLQNLEVDVASLLAGLGLGGLAFALAAKDTVANIFGSVMIFADRPFQIGDWIMVRDVEGIVEEVGFRSTRLRTFRGSRVTIPNSMLADSIIDNHGERSSRRVKQTLGLTTDTPPEKIESFCTELLAMLRARPAVRPEPLEVKLGGIGESSLDVLVCFFLDVPDWSAELKEKHEIYLAILRLAASQDVAFAFPTQTLHLMSEAAAVAAEARPKRA